MGVNIFYNIQLYFYKSYKRKQEVYLSLNVNRIIKLSIFLLLAQSIASRPNFTA